MQTIGGRCPVCHGDLYLERLRCQNCGTALEGAFALSPLFGLEAEQIRFVEMLVKHQGNIQRVAEEMGVSYRTARNRMDEIAKALGYALPEGEPPAPSAGRRREILEKLEAGEITSEQAVKLLRGEEE